MKPFYPLAIWLQPVDEWGADSGQAWEVNDESLVHLQIGDSLKNPSVESEGDPLAGEWLVQDRQWSHFHEGGKELAKELGIPWRRHLTIYLKKA